MEQTLGTLLKTWRKEAGLTCATLAKTIGATQPTISKIENDDLKPTIARLERILDALDAGQPKRIVARHLLRSLQMPGCDSPTKRNPSYQQLYLELEKSARSWIDATASNMFPGSLATRAYSAQVVERLVSGMTTEQKAGHVETRSRRREMLLAADPSARFLVNYTTLTDRLCEEETHLAQARSLLDFEDLPNVQVRIIRPGMSWPSIMVTGFKVYENEICVTENLTDQEKIQSDERVPAYVDCFETIWRHPGITFPSISEAITSLIG